jgi:UDP-glucose 4-epimerase
MRVLITGMGGELGARVASILERRGDAVAGIDVEAPRHALRRAEFHRVDPYDRAGTAAVVHRFRPTAVVHLGVFEPSARRGPARAVGLTATGVVGLCSALVELGGVDRIVARSGIEVYGRRRGSALCPDEDAATDPTSPFGHSLRHVEQVVVDTARALGAPASLLRFAPIVGPGFPSPLARVLRLPAVPVSVLDDPPFSVLHHHDAAAAVVAALDVGASGPLNVVGPGAVTVSQAARLGGRLPMPVVGPLWRPTRIAAEMAGAPLPEHVQELLIRGRTAAGHRSVATLGVRPAVSTPEVVAQLVAWRSALPVTDLAEVA